MLKLIYVKLNDEGSRLFPGYEYYIGLIDNKNSGYSFSRVMWFDKNLNLMEINDIMDYFLEELIIQIDDTGICNNPREGT